MRWRGTELLPTELADCVHAGLVEPETPALEQLRHTPCGSSVCNRQPTLRVQAHLVEATGSLTEGENNGFYALAFHEPQII